MPATSVMVLVGPGCGMASLSQPRPRRGRSKDSVEHWLGEFAGEGVLLADVVAADDEQLCDLDLDAVPEAWARPRDVESGPRQRTQGRVPRKRSQADDRAQRRQHEPQLGVEPGLAGVTLGRRRL